MNGRKLMLSKLIANEISYYFFWKYECPLNKKFINANVYTPLSKVDETH